MDLLHDDRGNGLPTQSHTIRFCAFQTADHTLTDDLLFELSEDAEHTKQRFAGGCAGIDSLLAGYRFTGAYRAF